MKRLRALVAGKLLALVVLVSIAACMHTAQGAATGVARPADC